MVRSLRQLAAVGAVAIVLLPCIASVVVLAPAGAASSFPDVPPSHPFHEEITWMVDEGIAEGFPDGTFKPQRVVTRQAMSSFMAQLWQQQNGGTAIPAGPPLPGFSDVPTSHPFYDEISWMASTGISAGYPNGTFRPSAPVTRQAMASFLFSLWELLGGAAGTYPDPGFDDLAPGDPFFDEISWMATFEVTGGFSDGTFRPDDSVARQAMSAFMFRLYAGDGPVLVVNEASDGKDALPGDLVCEMTAGQDDCSLRAAVDEANAHPSVDTIEIEAGTDPVVDLVELDENDNLGGDFDTTYALTIVGNGNTVDGNELDKVFDHRPAVEDEQNYSLTLEDLTVTRASEGAAVRTTGSSLALESVTVDGNLGEGVRVSDVSSSQSVFIDRSTISDNFNEGVLIENSVGPVQIVNSTVSGNGETAVSGLSVTGAPITVTFSTLSGDAGLLTSATASFILQASIVDTTGSASAISGTSSVSGSYNVVSDATCGLDDPSNLESTDALLGPLANNTGPTLTHLPGVGSPAIDAIPSATAELCDGTIATDQHEVTRPQGDDCDIGAVEIA